MSGAGETSNPSLPSQPPTPKKRQRKIQEAKPKPTSPSSTEQPAQAAANIVPHPLFPQPFPPAFLMNPSSFPMNGSPFPPQQGHQPYPQGTQQPHPGQPVPGTPGPYGYAMPPAYHGYPYQYPMVMYGSPQPAQHEAPHSPAEQSTSTTKRKRKTAGERAKAKAAEFSDDEGASGSDLRAQAQADLKKRTKTQRACDSCRSRKIRCDVLAESEPPMCQHCKQYGFDCTFFLPITETRFKKKSKADEEAAERERVDHRPNIQHTDSHSRRDIGVFGPTSAAHLLHSQATIPSRIYEVYDQRYNHSFEVSRSGDGLISVQKPAESDSQPSLPRPIETRVEPEIVQQLVNAYFAEVAPLLPIVTREELLANNKPPPILLYSMCLVAAARREVPQAIFDSIRYHVNNIIKAEDVLSTATTTNLQALLILCMSGDCHSQFVPNALSALWVRSGTAIRMAQDLGLHRAESVKHQIELRRRLWGACVICDRWTSLTYGHPYMIDVQDCDARLPSSGDPNDIYMDELVRLSVVLGRVLKTIYSPSGLTLITDEMLHKLLSEIEGWAENLPESLRYTGIDSPRTAGLLHLLYTCVCILFWRVFMRISYSCPAHLKFGLTVEGWSKLVTLTGESIDWLDANERMYDVWLLVSYAATACALVQYHTWARREDSEACNKLRKLRDCVRRWEASLSPDHMSARRKTAEIIALLYEATQGPRVVIETPPALNPTGGVKGKQPLDGLDYQKDPSRPGGGIFVAHGKARESDFDDLPEGTVIKASDEDSEMESRTERNRAQLRSSMASSSAFAPPLPNEQSGSSSSPSLVNFTPIGGDRNEGTPANMNPAMNTRTGPRNQVINILDMPQSSDTLAHVAMTDSGFLEGIPSGMFDYGQWDSFFSRLNSIGQGDVVQNQRQQRQ
ncbi:fungal-specific transcription factor domain-containing protein [Mycena floridula]|nr:fungal-specific transcription factor domain-containing protein [Mycena floridula]